MKNKWLIVFILTLAFCTSLANRDVTFAEGKEQSVYVIAKPQNQWGPLNGTATNIFYVPASGEYVISGLPADARISLYQTNRVRETYPQQVERNYISELFENKRIYLERDTMYYLMDPVNFNEQSVKIKFLLRWALFL